MKCVKFLDGVLFYEKGDRLQANHEMYLVWLRDKLKRLNGHFLINFTSNENVAAAARMRRSHSLKGKEEDAGGCGIGYYIKTGDMDYLFDESLGLKIYVTKRALAVTVKMGLRGFLDAVCIFNAPSAFLQLLPFAEQILGVLNKIPQLRPILPTVEDLMEKKKGNSPYSRFTLPTIATFGHYFRGPRHTNYLTETPWLIDAWNEDQDSLPQTSKLEWMSQCPDNEEDEDDESDTGDSKRQFQPTTDILAATVWIKSTYKIEPNSRIFKKDVFKNYLDNCPQTNFMSSSKFGVLVNNVFKNLKSSTSSGRQSNGSCSLY